MGCLAEETRAKGTRGGGLDSFGSRDECQNEQMEMDGFTSRRGKRVPTCELAGLIERALN